MMKLERFEWFGITRHTVLRILMKKLLIISLVSMILNTIAIKSPPLLLPRQMKSSKK